jgi:hypothetical protein
MARRPPWIRRLRKNLTLTQISVITGIIASVVGTLAVLGIVGRDGDDSQPPSTQGEEVAEARPPVPGAVYSGRTDQGKDMHLRVYVDGRSIRDLTVPLEGECSDGGPFTTTYRQGSATFVITGGILSGSSTVTGVTGEIVSGIFRIYARFQGESGRTVKGTVSEHAEVRDGGTCDTREITFTATAPD